MVGSDTHGQGANQRRMTERRIQLFIEGNHYLDRRGFLGSRIGLSRLLDRSFKTVQELNRYRKEVVATLGNPAAYQGA